MKPTIKASNSLQNELAAMFCVSPQWVRKALSYSSDAVSSDQIRRTALERGATDYIVATGDEVLLDEGTTLRQSYPNGAILELDKVTGDARILRDGKVCAIHPNIELSRIRSLQQLAQEL